MAISDADLWHQVHAQREDGIAAMFLIRDVEPRTDQPQIVVIQLPYPVGDESRLPDQDSYRRLDEFQERWIEPACEALGWTFVAWKSEDGSFYLYLYGDGDPNALVERLTPFDAELSFYNDRDAEWAEYATLRELVEQAEAAPDDEHDHDHDHGDHDHDHDHGDHDHDHDHGDHDHVHAHGDSAPVADLDDDDDDEDGDELDRGGDDGEPAHLSNGHNHGTHLHHVHGANPVPAVLRPGRSTRAATVGALPSNLGKREPAEAKRASKPVKSAAAKPATPKGAAGKAASASKAAAKAAPPKAAPAKKPTKLAAAAKKIAAAAKKIAAAAKKPVTKKPTKLAAPAKKPAAPAKKPAKLVAGKKPAAPAKKPAPKAKPAPAKSRATRR